MGKRKNLKKKVVSTVDSEDEGRQEKWNAEEEGFCRDEVDKYLEEKEVLSLQRSGDLEPASFSEGEGSDEEVLKLELSDIDQEDEEESEEEDEEEAASEEEEEKESEEEEDHGPSDKAWGKRKKDFYNTDYIDDEGDNTSDESLAEEEQREALSLQRRMIENLHDTDFGLETIVEPLSPNLDPKLGLIKVPKDHSMLSKEEQLIFIQEEWPEFLELFDNLKTRTETITHTLSPLVKKLKKYPQNFSSHGGTLISNLNTLYRLYSLNVNFYLTLRANQAPVEDHPVISRIITLREILGEVESVMTEEKLKELERAPLRQEILKTETNIPSPPIVKQFRKRDRDTCIKEDPLEFYERIKRAKTDKKKVTFSGVCLPASPEVQSDKKRAITYQIAHNKGLTPKRRKDQRNPRVKHRKKFEKALTKHRRIVRPVQKELYRYGGEKGGIRSRLARSVKIK